MSSDEGGVLENGCVSAEVPKTKKTLKSLVIPHNDPLKIKLKISKRDLEEPSTGEKGCLGDVKPGKFHRSGLPGKPEAKNIEEEEVSKNDVATPDEKNSKGGGIVEAKMVLRSKKESGDGGNGESEEIGEEKRKKKELYSDKEYEKPKKRGKVNKSAAEDVLEKGEEVSRRRRKKNEDITTGEEPLELVDEQKEIDKESFCWACHKDGSVVKCDTCPRVFHLKCVSLTKDPANNWICPECSMVLHAEKMSTRSEAMKSLSLDQLCTLLNFAIGRMKNVPESQAFWKPVDPKQVPFYDKYITNPMDLHLLEKNMKAKMYGSPQAFLADTKWLLHNSIIFNSNQSPLTSTARFLVKICRQEMAEIENCPDCYLNAHTKEHWFIEVCRKPHILIWARLKGFPFWPAKAMSTNLKTQQVDARFFGAHDKAWVPVKECYLYSKNSPQLFSKKRADLDEAFLEAENYIKKIRQKYGTFCYAPDKTPFLPEMYDQQLLSLIPNYKEEKVVKKKRKNDQTPGENGIADDKLGSQSEGKKLDEQGVPHKIKLKRLPTEGSPKIDGEECMIDEECVSEEKVVNDGLVSPEDEIARKLEIFGAHLKSEGEAADENSTDLDEDASVPIPEHGYSRPADNSNEAQAETSLEDKDASSTNETAVTKKDNAEPSKSKGLVVKKKKKKKVIKDNGNECVAESSDVKKSFESNMEEKSETTDKTNNEQCEVSSTSADLKEIESADKSDPLEMDISITENSSTEKKAPSPGHTLEASKKDDEKTTKSFENLTCDQKQKILNEAKLLANIDEMTALGKQKILNELGLDASNVDIRQLAQENRQILETLNKTCQSSQSREFNEMSIKNEEFEQYLLEENSEENIFDEKDMQQCSPMPGSIKVRDIETLSKQKSVSPTSPVEPIVKIMNVHSLKDLKEMANETNKSKKRKSIDEGMHSKKSKLDPVVKLIRLDYDQSVEKLNRKLRLSDEVSLLMVDGDKKISKDGERVKLDGIKGPKKGEKNGRARKSMLSRSKNSAGKNISVISVDTENSVSQKNLLKSLRMDANKLEDGGMRTVLITTNEKGIKNVDVKNGCETAGKKQIKEVTIEAVKDSGKAGDQGREGNMVPPKNLTVVANSHLIVTNPGTQPNLALAQNNLGQLSLVHLSNLTSGIQTNFVNLANETIGFNNSIGTLYASSGFGPEFPVSTAAAGSVIITPTSVSEGNAVAKGGKPDVLPISRHGSTGKSSSGISVKSPATLGLITSSNKIPPLITLSGEGVPLMGDVGSVTAELNKHSIKMAEYMRATIEDILRELSSQGSLEAKYKLLSLEMEKLQWRHQQELMELKHRSERSLIELRNSLESDKQKCLSELKVQMESQHQKIISETKRKQWCANCGKEALFYCCWNTSYCDYPCQQQHWPGHMSTCAQLGNSVSIGSAAGSQLQGKAPRIKYQNSNHVPAPSSGSGRNDCDGNGGSPRDGTYRINRFL